MQERVKALIEERQRAWEGNEKLLRKAAEENRDLTADEQQEFDARDADVSRLKEQIDRLHKVEDQRREQVALAERSAGTVAAKPAGVSGEDDEERSLPRDPEERAQVIQERDNEELRSFLRGGFGALSESQRRRYAERNARLTAARANLSAADSHALIELRAQSVGTDSEGGYIVPEGFFNRLTIALEANGGARSTRSTVLRTSSGETMPMPTVNDTSNDASILAENTEVDETDITFAEKQLDAYLYSSDLVRVPVQLLQDSAFDIGGLLARLLGERLGRKTNADYTTGTGSSQPNGFVTASTLGKTAASATAIAWAEMIDLKYSVDPAYRMNGEWSFGDDFLKKAKQLVDGNSRPLFQPDVQSGRVDRIDGDPFVVNQDMADVASAAKVAVYGDFSYFFIRDVLGVQLVRLNERFVEFFQVGFMSYLRTDSELLNAGTNPLKHYIMA